MKRIYVYFCCILALLSLPGCKKEGLMTYNASDNIYFNYIVGANPATFTLGNYADSAVFSFAFSRASLTDTLLPVPVKVTGLAQNVDRTFSLSVDPSSTASVNTHYELPSSFVIHAGKTIDTTYIKLKRAADLKTKEVNLLLRLVANDQFKTQLLFRPKQVNSLTAIPIDPRDTVRMQTLKIIFSDKLSAGPYWDSDYWYHFGTFSEKKVRLINQIVGMPLDFWSVPANISTEQTFNRSYYSGFTARYLSDQAAAGNIILEADGITPMKMGYQYP